MADLDLTAFEKDVVEHVLVGRARSRMLEDVRAEKPWNVDLGLGELLLGDEKYEVQILGTASFEMGTFMWAWANPGAGEWTKSLAIANTLKAKGSEPGQAVYGQRSFPFDWVNPNEISLVAGEISGGHPVFMGTTPTVAAMLLVTSLRLELKDFPLAYLPGILVGIPELTRAEPRRCAKRFAERLGFAVEEKDRSLVAKRGRDGFDVSFNRDGYVTEVNLHAGGA